MLLYMPAAAVIRTMIESEMGPRRIQVMPRYFGSISQHLKHDFRT